MNSKLSKLVNVYKKYGFCGFCRKLYAYVKANYFDKVSFVTFLRQRRIREQLRELLAHSRRPLAQQLWLQCPYSSPRSRSAFAESGAGALPRVL